MKNFISKIFKKLTPFLKEEKEYMRLESIKYQDNELYCEFNYFPNTDGRLKEIPISEIFDNIDIHKSISPSALLLIGSMHGMYKKMESDYKISSLNLVDRIVTLENITERITINFNDLFHNLDLLNNIYAKDAFTCGYSYGYQDGAKTSSKNDLNRRNKKTVILKILN